MNNKPNSRIIFFKSFIIKSDNDKHQTNFILYSYSELRANYFRRTCVLRKINNYKYAPPGVETSDANDTSGFYCRKDTLHSLEVSSHSYGLAIDINPPFNPAISNGKIEPITGSEFLDRSIDHPGMIKEGNKIFLIFTNHGWSWGEVFLKMLITYISQK